MGKQVFIEHIRTRQMLADPMTKGLPPSLYVGHVRDMGLVDTS